MVIYSQQRLDAVFGALADRTRRAVLARLSDGDRSVGELAQPFSMSLPGFMKHLGILQDAGLIEREKSGRVVSCSLNAAALREALEWLARYEQFWNQRLDRLGSFLQIKESRSWPSPPTKKPASESAASTKRRSPPSTRRGSTRNK
jgi:DNA-binding transcriptional ArsR family regulator